jgi:hypothetical protein
MGHEHSVTSFTRREAMFGAAAAGTGFTLRHTSRADAAEDPRSHMLVGSVSAHPSTKTVEVVALGTARRVRVSLLPGAQVKSADGARHRLSDLPLGTVVVAEAPMPPEPLDERVSVLAARGVASCNVGLRSDVSR